MKASYIAWGLWGLGFLLIEFLGEFRVFGWVTLSETSWALEAKSWLLHALFFGFLVGLLIHIVYKTEFWKALVVGWIVALLAHFLNKRWP